MDVSRMRSIMDDIMVGIARLAHIAEIHERRLDQLEEQK